MEAVWNFLVAHQLAVGWVFSIAVGSLPAPLAGDRWYQWFYKTMNGIGANVANIRGKAAFTDDIAPSPPVA